MTVRSFAKVLVGFGLALLLSACASTTSPPSQTVSQDVMPSAVPVAGTTVIQTAPTQVAPSTSHSSASVQTAAVQRTEPYDPKYNDNLRTCLDGSYQSLCRRDILQPGDVERVNEAEYRANLRTCLDGSYPSLCRRAELRPEDVSAVDHAEYSHNLKTCLDGSYSSICRHKILTPVDAERVAAAEYQYNLKQCLDGRYPVLCNKTKLSAQDQRKVAELESKKPSPSLSAPTIATGGKALAPGYGCAENGSCYGDISENTGRPKTTHVSGYYRKDGTYVRSHYRSSRR